MITPAVLQSADMTWRQFKTHTSHQECNMLDEITRNMLKITIPIIVIAVVTSILSGCINAPKIKPGTHTLPEINSIQDLQNLSVFSFAIMSDNKGDSPENSPENFKMVKWIKQSNDQFVIGLGDHLKRGWDNSFLDMIKEDPWWNQNFYPNIADGENEYFGECQSDWGAGGKLLEEMNFSQHSNVAIRKNGSEYYAKISVDEYTVHLIQLHYPDIPRDCDLAFPEDSRQYLKTTLQSIDKGSRDIIIAAAHSRTGNWISDLDKELRKIVMDKADLVLSATTHYFQRIKLPDYKQSGALLINTGSVNYPLPLSHGGYVHVSVLEDPLSLIVQYINVEDEDEMELQDTRHAILKVIGGEISFIDF